MMRCEKLFCSLALLLILRLHFTLAAPSKRLRRNSEIKDYMQVPPEKNADDGGAWWPVTGMDDQSPGETPDYKDEKDSEKKLKSAKLEEAKKVSNKTEHKTVCEVKNGPCAADKKGHHEPEETLDQLLKKMKDVLSKESKTFEADIAELRRLISKVIEKVHELQKSKGSDCLKNSPVAEIEERHTVERKLVHAKEHHDKGQKKDELIQTNIPHGQPLPSPPSPPAPPAAKPEMESPPQYASDGYNNPPPAPAHSPHLAVTPKYIDSVTPDVNYNGGIQRPMDELKRDYPDGYWPDKADLSTYYDDGHSNQGNGGVNKDYEVEQEKSAVIDALAPEYLEEIIKRERNQNQYTNQDKQHHVVQHQL